MAKATKKNSENYIFTYYQAIKNGSVNACKWVVLLYEYIIRELEAGAIFYDGRKAQTAVEWIERNCFHTEGPLAPGPFLLAPWQKALIACIFGLVDAEGVRQFAEVVLIVARKNGKSLLAAAIAKYVWYLDGGYGARVYTLAPKLEQADIIYNNVWQMVTLDPAWKAGMAQLAENKSLRNYDAAPELARHRQTDLYLPVNNGTVKKIAFSAKKSDGFNPSLCICDEIAAWEGDRGLKQYEVMKSGMGARGGNAMMLSCSTAGYVNGSIYDELLGRATRFLLGNSKERRLLPFLYMIDDPEKWNDLNELQKSNPNLGVSVSVNYLLEEIAIAEGSLSKKAEFLTKYCNVKQNSSLAWLPGPAVEKSGGAPLRLEDFAECYAVAGIDLSRTIDLTACTCVIERGGELYVFAKFWLPAEKLREAMARDALPYDLYVQRGFLELSGDNFVDYEDCARWLRELVEKYRIYPLQIGYDRYSSTYLINDLKAYGFHTDDVYQGFNLTPVIREFEGLLKDGKVHIGDNDLLKIHLLNAALKQDAGTERVKLVKLQEQDHIDGVAALMDAFTVRQKHWPEIGGQLTNER